MSRFSHSPQSVTKTKSAGKHSSSLLEHLEEKKNWTAHKLKWQDEIQHLPPTQTKRIYEIWMESDVEAVRFITAAPLSRSAAGEDLTLDLDLYGGMCGKIIQEACREPNRNTAEAGFFGGWGGGIETSFSGDHRHFSPLIP